VGLRDLVELAGQITDLLAASRPADAGALVPDTERPEAGVDVDDLRDRADAARTALATAVTDLEALDDDADIDDVVDALLAGADAGIAGSVPGEDPPAAALSAARRGRSTLAALDAAEAAFVAQVARATSEGVVVKDSDHAAHHLERLRIVLGRGFPAVPRFALPGASGPDAEDVRATLAASSTDPALVGADREAAAWVAMHVPVRPAVARLAGVLEASEMLGGRVSLADLHLAQLPHRPGAAWIGRPFEATPPVTTGWVIHAAARPAFDGTLAGIVVDQWTEAVPSTVETTGMSFHFDAPGARAPQTVLIATPTDRTADRWSVDALVGTVREAVSLARIRPLDIDDIDVAARFLPAAYLPFNIETKLPGLNLAALVAASITIQNAAFEAADP
jgi:hypothetical protein